MSRKLWWFLAVASAVVALDQATKIWVYTSLPLHGEIPVIPGLFSIVHAQNPGAANGLLRDFAYRQIVFLGFAGVAVWMIVNLLRQLPPERRLVPAILGMILGGAVGNAIDRIHKQTVTDFLRVYTENDRIAGTLRSWFGTAEYPSFNVADIALVVGVVLFLARSLTADDTAPPPARTEPPAPTG